MRQEPHLLQAHSSDLTPQTARQQEAADLHALPDQTANSDEISAQIDRIAAEIAQMWGSLRRTMWKSLLFLYIPLILGTIVSTALLGVESLDWIGIVAPILAVVGHIVVMRWAERRPNRKLMQCVQALAQTDDIRAVGPLIDAFALSEAFAKVPEKIQVPIMFTLMRLLPRLQSDDADQVSAAQRGLLCEHLTRIPIRSAMDSNPAIQAYRATILQSFAWIGDTRVLPTIQLLAAYEGNTAAQKRLRAEAQDCLPHLQRRIAEAHTAQTLLRASSRPNTENQSLLRAAEGVQETPVDQLLRPGNPES